LNRYIQITIFIFGTIGIAALTIFSLIETKNRGLYHIKKENIQISGTNLLQKQEILNEIYSDELTSVFSAPTSLWKKRLEDNPYVAKADVVIRLPYAILIKIVERLPVGQLGLQNDFWIDSLGIILPQRPIDTPNLHLPFLSNSVNIQGSFTGKKINHQPIEKTARTLGLIKSRLPNLFTEIEKIHSFRGNKGQIILRNKSQAFYDIGHFKQLQILDTFLKANKNISRLNIDVRFKNQVVTKKL